MGQKNQQLAYRLADILVRLNRGDRLEVNSLAEEFKVSPRTVLRDFRERLVFLDWAEFGPKYYSLEKTALGRLYAEDIERFAHFASIQNLFPKIHRDFFQKQLTKSVCVKGFNYENLDDKREEFDLIKQAIETHKKIVFTYIKNDLITKGNYTVEPYLLLNRQGIWYLMAQHGGKTKTFCFSQMERVNTLKEVFEFDHELFSQIKRIDSIHYGKQLPKVELEVNAEVAIYFRRRALLPNQEILEIKENGNLRVVSYDVSEHEILAITRYWIPNIRIIEPSKIQDRLLVELRSYLDCKQL